MRGKAITVLKYLVFAAFFLTLGPILIKIFFDDDVNTTQRFVRQQHVPQGLPLDPDEIRQEGVSKSMIHTSTLLYSGMIWSGLDESGVFLYGLVWFGLV